MLKRYLKLNVAQRITIFIIIGCITLFSVVLIDATRSFVAYRADAVVARDLLIAKDISLAINELQLEREATVKMLRLDDPTELQAKVMGQRQKSDQVIQSILASLTSTKSKYFSNIQDIVTTIKEARSIIDKGQSSEKTALDSYKGVIETLFVFMEINTSERIINKDVAFMLNNVINLSRAKESCKLERPIVFGFIKAAKPLANTQVKSWVGQCSRQEARFADMQRSLDGALHDKFQTFIDSSENKAVDQARSTLMEESETGTFSISTEKWLEIVGARIEKLQEVEHFAIDIMIDQLKRTSQHALNVFLLIVFTILAGFTVLGYVGYSVIISITKPLKKVLDLMIDVSKTGDFSLRTHIESSDEIGLMAEAINDLLASLQTTFAEINQVMSGFSQGDLGRTVECNVSGDLLKLKESINQTSHDLSLMIKEANLVMHAISQGDLAQQIQGSFSGDFAILKDSINLAGKTLLLAFSDINRVMGFISSGDLREKINLQVNGDIEVLKDSINSTVDVLQTTIGFLSEQSTAVATGAEEVSRAIDSVSEGNQSQVDSIEHISQAIEQTAGAVMDVSKSTERASHNANTATQLVSRSQDEMNNMKKVMANISENSQKINKITDVIGEIANQTNLLSLNAAIEAARAGEQGKGFAVVAEEVRKLAENSANSVHEISELVSQAVSEANLGVKTSQEVSQNMIKVSEAVVQTDDMLQQIAATMEETSAAMEEMSANIMSLRSISETNASAAEEITATVAELAHSAKKTNEQVSIYKL